MAVQFDLYEMADGQLVVVLQNDLLSDLRTRVVAPLLPLDAAPPPLRGLNPALPVGEDLLVLMPQLMATLTLGEMGVRKGSLAHHRDQISRAFDTLWMGV